MSTTKKTVKTAIWAIISIVLCISFVVGCSVADKWSSPLGGFFGYVGGTGASQSALNAATNTTKEDIDAAAESISRQIIQEGTVLLKNEGALPLAEGSKVSVFGVSSAFWMTGEKVNGTSNTAFTQALTNAGLEVNKTLRSFYKSNSHKKFGTGSSMGDGASFTDWKIDETPYSEYTDAVIASYPEFNDAAFVIFSRGGSEGGDLPMWMDAQGGSYDQSYMSLSAEENELLSQVTANFDKVIVVLHSANAMDMQMLRDYDIDAVLWVPGTGDTDLNELGALIAGKADFSGRSVDTYVYNSFSTPSVQNFGDFRYVDASGQLNGYSYVNYAEGIYIGYKYYETRYEDTILGVDGVGDYRYDDTVAFAFGTGLSYNEYEWADMTVSQPDGNGQIAVTVKVKNNGSLPGKSVVELYTQSPYTDYDKENGIEKSAVNLVGFAKTSLLAAGDSETVTITVNTADLASWDSSYSHDGVTGAYVLDAGTYYFAAAANAHEAINGILATKGASVTSDALVVTAMELSEHRYITTSNTGVLYKNNFTDSAAEDGTYLSRSNWKAVEDGSLVYQTGTMDGVSAVMAADGRVGIHTVSDEAMALLSVSGWASSGNPNDPLNTSKYPAVTFGASYGLKLSDLAGKSYDDPNWEHLLDQLTLDNLSALFAKGGYGTVPIDNVGKPETKEYDGPARILNLFSGESSYVFPAEVMMASTWNTELIEAVGDCIGDECILEGVAGWYAPAMNIHRTAFSGRNFEYYAEDPVLSGIMATAEVKGVQKKGVYAYIKHFALNDQETNRGANNRYAALATEQAIREIYLEPFRRAVVDGNANGIMASMNRVGYRYSISNYGLLTETLRKEWGFNGIAVTDYISSLAADDAEAGVAAGLDLQLITFSNPLSDSSLAKPGVQSQLREMAHHVLYTQANSLAVDSYDFGTPLYRILLIVLGIIIGLYILWSGYLVIKYCWFKKSVNGKAVLSKGDKIGAVIAGVMFAIMLVGIGVWFIKDALPALKQAFTL